MSLDLNSRSLTPTDLSNQFTEKVLLIVPCYNESERLHFETFRKETPASVSLLFADDGSKDNTFQLLEKFASEMNKQSSAVAGASAPATQAGAKVFVYKAPQNMGKAAVIQAAYLFAKEKNILQDFEWIGFWDADLATPLIEVVNLVTYRNLFSPQYKALFASRVNRYGSKITRKPIRHYLSRIFVTFTDLILGVKAYDSQCGAKLFHHTLVDKALGQAFVSRWVFDIEIVKRVGTEQIVEVPVQKWEDVPGSKMKLARESFRVLMDLFRIRAKYK